MKRKHLCNPYPAIETSLEAARRDAPGEISAAQADITKAWKYINAYDEDIRESLEDDLREAEKKLNTASEELNKEKADYLMVVKLAREANDSADKILAQARTEHEAAERMRSKAASALRDARSRVSIAREYIQDHHHGYWEMRPGVYLVPLYTALRQAEAASDSNANFLGRDKRKAPPTVLILRPEQELKGLADGVHGSPPGNCLAGWRTRRRR